MNTRTKATTSTNEHFSGTKVAWHRPAMGRIDIKRTMAGTGSKSDTFKTANAVSP